MKTNHYGLLCTEMYEMLHRQAPDDELEFYLSYARKDMRILEALCGSGRFLVPFLDMGFDIAGVDSSEEMLEKLKRKAPDANVHATDILKFESTSSFDYIFITSGSVSLFTDMALCEAVLKKMKSLLSQNGIFVFAVDTIANRCVDDDDYMITATGVTDNGCDLVLKTKNFFDIESQTQFSPGIYELYDGKQLLTKEEMDFQTHLYRSGEMETILKDVGFSNIKTYSSFSKNEHCDDESGMFLFECRLSRERNGA